MRHPAHGRAARPVVGLLTAAALLVGTAACSDDSGDSVPISEGAATHTYRYSFGSFAGSADRLTSRLVIEISTEFSGSCQATPDDPLTYVEDQVLRKLPES